jgi:hypothetical protein
VVRMEFVSDLFPLTRFGINNVKPWNPVTN